MDAVIRTAGLRKNFGSVAALDGLDLSVEAGTVHGFLGPNGAGKSTTIRVLLGLLRRTGGEVELFGDDPWRDAVALHRRVAYVPGDVTLWPNLTGGETIDLLLRLGGHTGHQVDARRAELLHKFELDPTKKGRSYSKGNRQKVALVAALAADADLYILDEPTSGLDPLMENVFQSELRALRDRGKTALLSSHILSEVEQACSVVSIVRAGKVVETGRLADLQHLRRTVLRVQLGRPVPIDEVRSWAGVHDASYDGNVLHCSVEPASIGAAIGLLEPAGIAALESRPPSLEELFLDRYREGATTR